MNKVEYLGLQIENELKKKEDEILKKFEEYLKNNSEKVNIKMNNVSFDDIVNYSGNNTEFFSNCPVYNISDDCFSLLLDCNGKTTISNNFRKKLQKVFIENVSKNIEELSYSNRILDNIELSLFPNLKEVSIKDAGEIISKNELEMFLKRSNIEEFNTDGKFDDDILKDGIFMDFEGDKYGVYKDKKISSGNFFYKEFINRYNTYSQNPYENIDTIIKVIEDGKNKFEIDENKDIMVYDKIKDIEKKETSNSIIQYNVSKKMIKLKNINKIEDAQRVIDSFVNSNYDISDVILKLENKTYSDMIKLKHLEKEYNLKIEYNNSYEKITADEFITMRATLDYYKSLIEDKNLSPLEKATFGYDIIKSFVYNEVKEDENKSISRNIHSIIESGNIVCVGYASFYAELMKEIACDVLFEKGHTIAEKIFEGVTYPYEVLPKISEFILELGKTLPADKFECREDNIWIAKSASVAPSAYIHGPAIIDEEAEIRHCAFIRGNAIVGKGAVVGNSTELKNVILFDKVQVPYGSRLHYIQCKIGQNFGCN